MAVLAPHQWQQGVQQGVEQADDGGGGGGGEDEAVKVHGVLVVVPAGGNGTGGQHRHSRHRAGRYRPSMIGHRAGWYRRMQPPLPLTRAA